MSVIVVGNAAVDTTFEVERLPQPGESILATAVREDLGGKGLNQAVAAARAGAHVRFHAAIGTDAAADSVEALLHGEGIGTEGLVHLHGSTDRTTVFVTPDGQNAIVTSAHQARAFERSAAIGAVGGAGRDDHLLLQGNLSPDVTEACATAAHAQGMTVVLNPSPIAFDFAGLWGVVDVVVANEEECIALGGEPDAVGAARRLSESGVEVVVVTRGGHDVLLLDDAGVRPLPVQTVEAVDTTGAGDAFCGTLVAGLDFGLAMPLAVERGISVSSAVVARPGAITSIPRRTQAAP